MWRRPSEARDAAGEICKLSEVSSQAAATRRIFWRKRGVGITVSKLIGQPRLTNTWATPHEQYVMLLRTLT